MIAPAVTQEFFDVIKANGWTTLPTIGKLNSKNCKAEFNKTVPKALRDEGWNAFLVIKNHRDRFKYFGFNVEDVAGALHIVDNPEFVWSGYVKHDDNWYAVDSSSLLRGVIPHDNKVILPEIEHARSNV